MSSPISSTFFPLPDDLMSSTLGILSPSLLPNIASPTSAGSTFVITSAMLSQHTLQAMVELEYVRVGTEVMNSALTSLDTAISITQTALNNLTTLQNLHNQITVNASTPFSQLFNFTDTTTFTVTITSFNTTQIAGATLTSTFTKQVHDQASYVSAYQLLASTYYGRAIQPQFEITMAAQLSATANTPAHSAFTNVVITSSTQSAYIIYVDMLKSAKQTLSANIAALSAITKPGDEQTLLVQLRSVNNGIPDLTSFSAVQKWAIDNYGGSSASAISKQGQFQQQITNAITGAESLNTSQQESVRRYMFVFEQYTQSAAAILTALDTLFQQISRGISS